MQLIEFTSRN